MEEAIGVNIEGEPEFPWLPAFFLSATGLRSLSSAFVPNSHQLIGRKAEDQRPKTSSTKKKEGIPGEENVGRHFALIRFHKPRINLLKLDEIAKNGKLKNTSDGW